MSLEFDGIKYTTIADVKSKYRVSEKSLRHWQKKGLLPEPPSVSYGGKTFRHYTADWCGQLEQFLMSKTNGVGKLTNA